MVDKRPLDERELDDLFGAAQSQAPLPSADLVARILADADQVADAAPAPLPERQAVPRENILLRGFAALGGWPSLAGLATAAFAGVAIGVLSPDLVASWSGGVLGASVEDSMGQLMPSIDGLMGEG